jgi:nicotinamide-nucleotide amidase
MKYKSIKSVVKNLIVREKTIATMESCTGGFIASSITNIEGASNVLKFSAVTYSNDYKIKMGVDPKIIDKYSVYSSETAKDMSKKISDYADSNYGVGVTGKLKRPDENNKVGDNDKVFISLYDKDNNKYYEEELVVTKNTRLANKKMVLDKLVEMFNKTER